MDASSQVNTYKMHKSLQQRVWELEVALKNLIDEHKMFQIEQDLKQYELILNKSLKEELDEIAEEASDCKCC